MRNSERGIGLVVAAGALALAVGLGMASGAAAEPVAGRRARSVIVLVGDGMSAAATTLARWVAGAPLALDGMHTAGVRTYAADSLITDSAPAATAFACGVKSDDDFVGVRPARTVIPGVPDTPEPLRGAPVASVLEAAALAGKATGIVATANLQHATPAAFTAHWPVRGDFDVIGEQQVYHDLDVALGGGLQWLRPVAVGGRRADGEDLVAVLRARGATVVQTRDELHAAGATGPLWGLFAADDMAYDLDRPATAPTQPSLAEMTRAAIQRLSADPDGFFLMVEGSKIDWAAHGHDPVAVVSDVRAFDAAVAVALEYARRAGDTVVLAFADHATGGLSIGSAVSNRTYATTAPKDVIDPLARATLTGEGIEAALGHDRSEARITAAVASAWNIELTPIEVVELLAARPGRMQERLGAIFSDRFPIGWTTTGHTGEDLFLYASGIGQPLGLLDNTEIARLAARLIGVDLDAATARLFVPADEALAPGTWRVDRSRPAGAVLVVESGERRAELPLDTDRLRLSGPKGVREIALEGIALGSPVSGRVFLPRQAVQLLRQP